VSASGHPFLGLIDNSRESSGTSQWRQGTEFFPISDRALIDSRTPIASLARANPMRDRRHARERHPRLDWAGRKPPTGCADSVRGCLQTTGSRLAADEIDRRTPSARPWAGGLASSECMNHVEEEWGVGARIFEHCRGGWRKSARPPARWVSYGAHRKFAQPVRRNGKNDDQSAIPSQSLISGEHVGGLAMSEPRRRAPTSSRWRVGLEGGATVTSSNGRQMWITPTARRTRRSWSKQDRSGGRRAASRLLIEKGSRDISQARRSRQIGLRGSETCELVLQIARCGRETVGESAAALPSDVRSRVRASGAGGPDRSDHAEWHRRGDAYVKERQAVRPADRREF